MNRFHVVTLLLSAILAAGANAIPLRAQDADSRPGVAAEKKVEKKPDLSGKWLSESPLDSMVEDDSPQPVNSFVIARSKEADFKARYLGARATSVLLNWDEEAGQFEGTKESRLGKVTFVVTPTDDPDVLNCEIEAEYNIKSDAFYHKDTWRRVRKESPAPKSVPDTASGKEVWRAAERYRQARVENNDTHPATIEARRQLELAVKEAFEIQLKEEQQRIAELKERLGELLKQSEEHAANREPLLHRRVDELIAAVERVAKETREHAGEDDQTVLRYEVTPDLTPQIKQDMEVLLSTYRERLNEIGFDLQKGQVALRVQAGMGNAHYYPNNRSIVMDPLVVGDQSVIRREYNHHALAVALGADAQEIFQTCSGIESALADYLGCSACDDPAVGTEFARALGFNGPYLRTMENQRRFTEISEKSGRHDVGEVLSGTLWDLRESIGKDVLDPLLVKSWQGIVKSDASKGQVVRFAVSLLNVVQSEDPALAKTVRKIFDDRGLTLP